MNIVREDYILSPEEGCAVGKAVTSYAHPTKPWLVQAYHEIRGSDRFDCYWRRRSEDNGRTWTEPEQILPVEYGHAYTLRKGELFFFYDPDVDRVVQVYDHGLMLEDDVLSAMRTYKIMLQISADGGKTFTEPEQLIQRGLDADHYLDVVWHGRNAAMTSCGHFTKLSDGSLLFPVVYCPLDEEGNILNPTGAYTFHYAAVLIGTWNSYASGIDWDLAQTLEIDPERSTRGLDEPTAAELTGGRALMIFRGSNQTRPDLRGSKWVSHSSDLGRSWSAPEPLTFDDGGELLSPATCSRLIRHSNGTLYWFGNILPENPDGNSPRYPLQIAQVDEDNGTILRESVAVIDDRGPQECEGLQLSNFTVHEDRETGEFHLSMHRLFPVEYLNWTANCVRYRIQV